MLKPNIEDISTIINKCKDLSLRKEELKDKKFLTPVQQGVFNAQNKPLCLYIWRLSDEVKREHFHNCNIPLRYTRAKSGRFVVTHDNRLELYSENQDGTPVHDGDRVKLDEELLVLVLKDKARKERQQYWMDNIQPLINVIDKLLFPFWDYLRTNGSWGAGEQPRIETAVQSQDPSALDELIRELEKVRYKVEIESNQKVVQQQAETEREKDGQGGGTAGDTKKPQGKGGQAIMSYDDILQELTNFINPLRILFKDVRGRSEGYARQYDNVLNVLFRLRGTIQSLEKILDRKNNKAIRRRCDEAKVSIKDLENIVSTPKGEPDGWMQVVTCFVRVFDDLDMLSESLAEASQSPSEEEKGGQPTAGQRRRQGGRRRHRDVKYPNPYKANPRTPGKLAEKSLRDV